MPYWTILRVAVEDEGDPGDEPQTWPLFATGSTGGSGGGGARGGGSGDGGDRGNGSGKVLGRLPSRLKSPQPPRKVHRPTNSRISVGYRIVVIDVEVSIHHPDGSAVAANREAVVTGLTRVSKRQLFFAPPPPF